MTENPTPPISLADKPRGAAFEVADLDFAYPGGQTVFRALSLGASPGEFIALVGPSGCGKTTLVNLLSGFLVPSAGRITIGSQAVAPELPALGYVFQTPQLFPWLDVLDNVCFGLRMRRNGDPAANRQKARHFLALVGLEDVAGKHPHQLSGGMQQRVALARALVLEPTLLLMDEPFAALDAITRAGLNDQLLRLAGELGQTVVFITHDVEEAVYLADRVLVLGMAPDGIVCDLLIDLPRPRGQRATRQHPRYAEACATLIERITAIIARAPGRILEASGAQPP
jgi:NitT/TauT family transport system ATP-binding protein